MELWIRSQDKRQLLKVNDGLFIANDTTVTYIGLRNLGHIGKYTTEERALEILDEIQELLAQEDYLHIRKSSLNILDDIEEPKYILRSCGLPKVYKMPEE